MFASAILDNKIPQLLIDGNTLDRYLFARHIPLEKREEITAKKDIQRDILREAGVRHVNELGKHELNPYLLITQLINSIHGNS